MNRKRPVLKHVAGAECATREMIMEFQNILEHGLLLAMEDAGVLNHHQYEKIEKLMRMRTDMDKG